MTNNALAKLHYFAGRGRAETTRWMLAVNEIPFENVPLETPEALASLRATGKLPFDQIPLLEIDGFCVSQSSALIRYLARRGDLYGVNESEALWCDMVAGAAADFMEPAMQAAFMPSHDHAVTAMKASMKKFGPRFEACIMENRSGFTCGSGLSFADVVLAQATSAYHEISAGLLDGYPLLDAHQKRIIELPGIAAYLVSDQRYPTPGENYVISAARTLQRALPAHMPDPDRFVIR
jgi:glutathione S-transferase